MLKLIKYEYRRNLAGAIAMLAGVLLAQGFYLISIMRKDIDMTAIAGTLLMFAAFLCGAGILIYSVALYSRELNAKTSYLTFMTPNSMTKILSSKLLAALFMGIAFVALLAAFAAWDFSLLIATFPEAEMVRDLVKNALPSLLNRPLSELLSWIGVTATAFLINFYSIVMLAYLAITLSATALQNKKLKGLMSALLFVILLVALQWLVEKLPGYDYTLGYLNALLHAWPRYLSYLAVIAVSFVVSARLLAKRVSL